MTSPSSSAITASLAALLAVTLAATSAHAQLAAPVRTATDEASAQLSDARRRYGDLDFAGAIESLRRALAVPGTSAALRLEAYEYLGASYVVIDRPDDARTAFVEMLTIDPYHALREPSGSPKIASFVAALRAEVAPDAALDPEVRVTAELPRAGRVGRALRVVVRAAGGAPVASIRGRVRGQADDTWRTLDAEREGATFVFTIPALATADVLELYVEARDAEGRVLARAGEPSTPLTLDVREVAGRASSPAIYERWWFWTAIGVVVGGASVGIGLATTSGERAAPGTLAPGRVELP
jgi:tetratricopeptide (TPR) repeat protein